MSSNLLTALTVWCSLSSSGIQIPGDSTVESPHIDTAQVSHKTEDVVTHFQEKAIAAAVKVETPIRSGYGTGTYMKLGSHRFVITAAHVIDKSPVAIITTQSGIKVMGVVVYLNTVEDVACILTTNIPGVDAVPFHPARKLPSVGSSIFYTGFPNGHGPLTFAGQVAGFTNDSTSTYVLVNTFLWFGSSGSGVFDENGRFIGVVSAMDTDTITGTLDGKDVEIPQMLSSLAWISPISLVNMDVLKQTIKLTKTEK